MDKHLTPIEQFIVDFVHDLRTKENLSQKEIGAIIGVDQSFIANIENINHRAKYNINHVDILADYFRISPKDFMPPTSLVKRNLKK